MLTVFIVYFDTLLVFVSVIAASWSKLELVISKIVTCFWSFFMLDFLIEIGRIIHIDMLAIFKVIDFVIRSHEDILFCANLFVSNLLPLFLEDFSFVFDGKLEIAFFYIKRRTRIDGGEFLSESGGWFFIDENFRVFNFIAYQF